MLTASLDGLVSVLDDSGNYITTALADSTSYRIVAGGDLSSADPLALSDAALQSGSGNVSLDGHTKRQLCQDQQQNGPDLCADDDPHRRWFDRYRRCRQRADARQRRTGRDLHRRPPGDENHRRRQQLHRQERGYLPVLVDSGQVNPDSAGDVSIYAGGNIIGIEQVTDDGSRTGKSGTKRQRILVAVDAAGLRVLHRHQLLLQRCQQFLDQLRQLRPGHPERRRQRRHRRGRRYPGSVGVIADHLVSEPDIAARDDGDVAADAQDAWSKLPKLIEELLAPLEQELVPVKNTQSAASTATRIR